MCEFSLAYVKSRAAKIGDRLRTHAFPNTVRGFAASEDCETAVCLPPGTELVFHNEVYLLAYGFSAADELVIRQRTAIFRMIDMDMPESDHDALEYADGRIVLLKMLWSGQEATVIQLPAQSCDKERYKLDRIFA